MITFGHMAKHSSGLPTAVRGPRKTSLIVALALLATPALVAAQTLTHTEDASPIPVGMLRFRITTGWSRYDERFINGGTRSLSDDISSDSLGPRQFPLLAPVENGLKTLSNNAATRLTLGRLAAQSDVRTVTTPIALELGVTRRLSVGIMVPIIQTRRSIHIAVNADSTRLGNVGYVPERSRASAAAANATVYQAFLRASDSLTTLLAKCPTSPTATGCAAVSANTAAATAARDQAKAFAQAIQSSLGIDSVAALLAPRAGSALATAIDARRNALNTQLQAYLGPTAGTSASVFTSASDFSYIDLQGRNGVPGFLQSALGGGLDSLQTSNRLLLGGVTFAARFLVFDHFQRDTLPASVMQSRFAVGGEVRLEAVRADSARNLGAISPARGSGVAVSSALDLVRGRIGATIAGRYDKSFARAVQTTLVGDPEAFYPYPAFVPARRTPGDVITLDVTPRFLLGQWFAIDGHYGIERSAAATYELPAVDACPVCSLGSTAFAPNTTARTAQRLGFGVRYSTFESYLRGVTGTPVEVSFTHLETITGDAGVPKVSRDQVQLRLYFGVFGKR